jgi:hypothetical protein
MVVGWDLVSDLKGKVTNLFNEHLHFHDGCGGQYFTLEKYDKDLCDFIVNYFKEKNIKVVFTEDSLQFTLEKAEN